MKIALINKVFSLRHGGGERYAVNLAKALCQQGEEVHCFGILMEDVPTESTIHQCTVPQWSGFHKVLAFPSAIRPMVASHHFDIIFGLTQYYPVDVFRMGGGVQRHWIDLRFPNKVGQWFHCLVNPVHLAQLYLESQIYQPNHYRIVITNSNLCKSQAIQYYHIPEERIQVVHTGVDQNLFNPHVRDHYRESQRKVLNLKKDDIAILFVSNNWKRKGMFTILQALEYLGIKGLTYKLIGVGKSKKGPFLKSAKKTGLDKHIHFAEATTHIERYYAAADVLVLPTLYDPFANVCIEAMACGLPVITTSSNGASEVIVHGRSGFVLEDAGDFKSLATFLQHLSDRATRNSMGLNAFQAVQHLTIERNLSETFAIFERLLKSKQTI